jgi:succinate-semialdehyde dehydrogenase / glutarate-semialdehyde dehydrogenase
MATTLDRATIEVVDPRTGETIGAIAAGGPDAADAAVRAARAAQPAWARRDPAERGEVLKEAARRLRAHAGELAELQSRENGKPADDSRAGVDAGIASVEQYAELGPLHRGRTLQGSFGATDFMAYEPRGVVALLVPWNDPIAIACGQIAAALVAGNTVVFKPSERSPLSGRRLIELMELPDGVAVPLDGDERAGRPLVAHPDVDVVMHTGSIATGREIAAECARTPGKKALLELGGKDPLIVDADIDPAWAAEQAASGAFANAGQICTSVERIYVHRDVAGPFLYELERVAAGAEIGPLIDERQRELVHAHVTDAVERGAVLHAGGTVPDGPGFFYPPTVLSGCDASMAVMRDETFGPVAPVQEIESFEDGLRAANDLEYGLAASVLTRSDAHAELAWRELRAGTVKINAVWGGAPGGAAQPRAGSGTGFGYGPELLDELTTVKVVHREPAP